MIVKLSRPCLKVRNYSWEWFVEGFNENERWNWVHPNTSIPKHPMRSYQPRIDDSSWGRDVFSRLPPQGQTSWQPCRLQGVSELRIIGGKARGRKIHSVPGETTRPITDKVKEALFNIIGPDIHGATLLDLFAGTGSVGIEALSRGAEYVCFVERNRQPIAIIRENLKSTGLEEGAFVTQADAFAFLEHSV